MGAKTARLMKLPDGKFATEFTEQHVYTYYDICNGELIDKNVYELEYWGNIKGAVESSIKELDKP